MPISHGRVASLVAGLSFTYTLGVTLVLMLVTGFFSEDANANTVLAWLTVPIVSSFCGWMCVRMAHPILRILVWFFVLATLFFCWIAVFSVGLFYLPTAVLLIFAALGPWDGDAPTAGTAAAGQPEGGGPGPGQRPA